MGLDSAFLNSIGLALPKARLDLILPFLLALVMAWSDIKTNRIPNYLTLGVALAGLAYQTGSRGWAGLADGFLGMCLGFALLIFFYWRRDLGAGDVKALAALGAWLGPMQTVYLFIATAFSGLLVLVGFLWWRGVLWGKIRRTLATLVNLVLLRPHPSIPPMPRANAPANPETDRIPYVTAMALGMAIICWHGFTS